ncbi:exodeoxyribonuclease I [Salmonella bongori]|nr:exodeoxyribonuclease I [Salmonella bongori]
MIIHAGICWIVMRACYALRPEGINWPENDDGLPSFRLEHLTQANGIEHSNAHDCNGRRLRHYRDGATGEITPATSV